MSDTTPLIKPTLIPTGGVIRLDFNPSSTGPWTLSRAVSVSGQLGAATVLYSGAPVLFYIDLGDGIGQPLSSTTSYVYTLATGSGTVVTAALNPSLALKITSDVALENNTEFGYVFLIKRLIEAGLNSLTLPDGWSPPSVILAMPLTGRPALPIVTINADLEQQDKVPIGQMVNTDFENNSYTITSLVKNRYRITVLCETATQREFYKKAIAAIYTVALATVLPAFGQDISHTLQTASSQVTSDESSPGFYFADIMVEFTGNFDVTISTTYPVVNGFTVEVNGVFGVAP
jgi:hypothetical protein